MSDLIRIASLIAALALGAPAPATAADRPESGGGSPRPPTSLPAGIGQPAPPLVADYSLRTRDRNGRWSAPIAVRLIRTDDRVSLERPGLSETWRRLDNGSFEFERAFDADRRLVDYAGGELHTLGIAVDWDLLRVALDREAVRGLRATGPARKGGVRYRSADGILLDWSTQRQLPVRLVRSGNGQHSLLTLVRTEYTATQAAARLDARIAGYARIDAADFGDREADPFVQKASQLDVLHGWRRRHGHEH